MLACLTSCKSLAELSHMNTEQNDLQWSEPHWDPQRRVHVSYFWSQQECRLSLYDLYNPSCCLGGSGPNPTSSEASMAPVPVIIICCIPQRELCQKGDFLQAVMQSRCAHFQNFLR